MAYIKKAKYIFHYLLSNLILIFLGKSGEKQGSVLVDQEAVKWGYRLFLDREPENAKVVLDKVIALKNSQELRRIFIQSDEFKQKNPASPALSGDEPRLVIEEGNSEAELQTLFEHIQAAWEHLGETEPYWSVLTSEKFLHANIQHSSLIEEFYGTGKNDEAQIIKTLERNGIDHTSFTSCLEYGCGVGRVTRWLAEYFSVVYGYDISRVHLQVAERYLAGNKNIRNVVLKQVKRVRDLEDLPRVDLIYSKIVLQHNPPPIIAFVIRQFVRALNAKGVALFQVPTYRLGYEFSLQKYLSNDATRREMEMHVLPQHKIFEIIRQGGGRVVEVIEDGWTGSGYKDLSNTFLIQKI